MLHKYQGVTRERDWAGVAACIPVRIGAAARLVLRSSQRHAPDRELVSGGAVDVLWTVIAVEEGRTVRRHAWIEGPMVVIDHARIILGQALEDVAVEIEQVKIARIATTQNGDQPGVV